jgi:hypothetical protein
MTNNSYKKIRLLDKTLNKNRIKKIQKIWVTKINTKINLKKREIQVIC